MIDWEVLRGRLLWMGWGLMAYLALITCLGSYNYVSRPQLFLPPFRDKYLAHLVVVQVHAFSSIAALALGPLLFLPRRWPRLHRGAGKVYLGAVTVAAPSGFLLGCMAEGGAGNQILFCVLACLWLAAAWRACLRARAGDYLGHRADMFRSYSLAFGAVLLRLELPLAASLGWPFESSYPWLSWLSWLPALAAAEWLCRPWQSQLRYERIFGKRPD